ncbi:MAG: M1 family metallopeptidase [Chitinophagaceae bacterium]|nr:M1 family metallopeptidase [Chitinophagaceae bacterium]
MKRLLFFPVLKNTVLIGLWIFPLNGSGQLGTQKKQFTRQDTLRGTLTAERLWWNVQHYDILVEPDYYKKEIKGRSLISFTVQPEGMNKKMQIDLQQPMKIDSIIFQGKKTESFFRDGNVYYIDFGNFSFLKNPKATPGKKPGPNVYEISIYFSGKPREAPYPPWEGGWIWTKDNLQRPWMTVACQGLGASVWYPCKDHQSDEPDKGATLHILVSDTLTAVGNGRLISKQKKENGKTLWSWQVKNPINIYNLVPYIGKYVHFSDTLIGENQQKLSLDYWVMDYHFEKAKTHFTAQVKPMLRAFEYWFGPYPFYEDGFKLVESPHLGMEHQSAIAYGNKYQNGYRGTDLSGSGWGLHWDYIIVHEAGHEWFANNISSNDIADMWVHEGFTMYSEALFIEYHWGKKAADEYVQGIRKKIYNDKPLIGPYGVNEEGSSDMYNKGANLLHTIRQVIDNDSLFRQILRGLNKDFYHKTVNSSDVEEYFSRKSGKNLKPVFDQYLRTIQIPTLEYEIQKANKNSGMNTLKFRWTNCIAGFNMPVRIFTSSDKTKWIYPTDKFQTIQIPENEIKDGELRIDPNFYVRIKKRI